MLNDLRYAFRTLTRARGFAAVAILAIAIGIGANTVIFSVVNAVLLTPLPYRNSQGLVLIQERIPKIASVYFAVSAPDVLDLARWTQTLDTVGAFEERRMNLSSGNMPKRVNGARVSSNLFPLLGIAPQLGRTFTPEEDAPGQRVTVLSHGLWQDRFGADPGIIGAKVQLDGESYLVTGVMPRGFVFPPPGTPNSRVDPVEFWIPMGFTPRELSDVVDNFDIGVIGRIKSGAAISQVRSDMTRVAQQIQRKYPLAYKDGFTLEIGATPLNETVAGPARPLLVPLLGAVGFVLLIACANVANLLLSRAAGRQHEIAIRAALGASRARVVRQVLTESMLLALLGGVLGVSVAWLSLSAFVAVLPSSIPHASEISMDWRVLNFALGLSLLTGIVFGSVPALGMGRGNTAQTLNEIGRGSTAGARRRRLKSILVVCDVALSMVLLMGAGLLMRSYVNAIRTDPGFRPQSVLSFGVALPENQYASNSQVLAFYRALIEKIEAIPGVREAGSGNFLPLMGSNWNRTFVPEGFHASDGKIPLNDFTPTYGPYLQALGIPLLRGRYFNDSDRKGAPPVVIVSENLARRYWPNQNPIGKRLKYGADDGDRPWASVVGVVANVKASKMEGEPLPHSYQPIQQAEDFAVRSAQFFVVRTSADPGNIFSQVRAAVASLDKELPIARMRMMQDVVDDSLKPRRFSTWVVGIFASVALFLSVLGIYGVIAFSVAQRTQEIGIRMALGARKGDVLTLFLREGLLLGSTGIIIGSTASFALTRYISSQLYGVQPTDVATLGAVAVILASTTLLATYLPARRAIRLDPMLALRHQ